MSEHQEAAQASGLDKAKLAIAILLVVGGIFAYYWFENQSVWLRTAYVLITTAAALALAWQTHIGHATLSFIMSSRNEVRKMVWPTRQETMQTTLFVMLTVLVVGVFMWLLDLALFWALSGITGQGA
ncbi:MAG TPA: preprotein translocase subunit SecE [Gammaproteobacteria bacterium]|jgi:preprotein translocase subunit SecE